MTSKTTVLVFSLYFLWFFVHTQTLTGTVRDTKTGEPLESVAVYFDNTTFGTTTDDQGYFSIEYTDAVQSPLVISYLGFEKVYITDYRSQTNLQISLKESAQTLDEVYLDYDDGLTRKQKLYIFKREFLGRSELSKSCKIKNEKDLYFRYDKRRKVLSAYAVKPIIIENKGLKYKISYDLVDFEARFQFIHTNTTDYATYTVLFSGTTFYTDLNRKDRKDIKDRRQKAYFGSIQHFMRSLYGKTLTKEKFEIYKDGWRTDPYRWFKLITMKGPNLKTVELSHPVSILYDRSKQSELRLKDKSFVLDAYGNYEPIEEVLFSGFMGKQRIAELLPSNYEPSK